MKKVNSTTIREKYSREKDYIVWEYEDSFNTVFKNYGLILVNIFPVGNFF
jgi:hypothetical protein